jgi:hypothetical protein
MWGDLFCYPGYLAMSLTWWLWVLVMDHGSRDIRSVKPRESIAIYLCLHRLIWRQNWFKGFMSKKR